jgi:hypothetical protein
MDLFTPVVPPDKFHPNFRTVLSVNNPYNATVLNQWAEGFVDRDGKFVREFQTTFNSSFWELYLHAILKGLGCTIDFSHHAPDFVVTGPRPFTLEATIASNAQGTLPESHSRTDSPFPSDLNEFNRSAVLRLVNSITAKSKKYTESYQDLPHVKGKPFVLAVAPFDQPFAYLQVHRAIDAALYGYYVDEQEFMDDPTISKPMPAYHVRSVLKTPEVEVPVGLFNDATHAHISAVIFNSCATWGKIRALSKDPNPFVKFNAIRFDPRNGEISVFEGDKAHYKEGLFDGLRVYHNPHATCPLDMSVFAAPEVFQGMVTDPETGHWLFQVEQPPLVCRTVQTFRFHAKKKAIERTSSERKGARKKKAAERQRKKKGRR